MPEEVLFARHSDMDAAPEDTAPEVLSNKYLI